MSAPSIQGPASGHDWNVPLARPAAPAAKPAAKPASKEDARVTRVSLWVSLVLPNLSAAVFAAALLQVLLVSAGTQTLFRDSDTGWHIRAGESIITQKQIPRTDPYSFTRAGREWVAWEWLSDAALGAAHRSAGLPAVALLTGVCISATAMAGCALALRLGANFFLAAAAAGLMLGVTSMHWLARPHVFSWLLALFFVAVAESHSRRRGKKLFWFLPVLAALWTNLHGSFLLGPVILLIYAIGHSLSSLRAPNSALRNDFALASLLSLAATFVNPYGWRLHAHVGSYLRDSFLMDRISEFRSYSFHSPGAWYVEVFLSVAAATALLAARRRAYSQALLAVVMLHLALYSARHLATAAVILLPLSATLLTEELRGRPSFRLAGFLNYSDRLRAWDGRIVGVAPLVLTLTMGGILMTSSHSVGFDPQRFPVRAAAFFAGREDAVRVFARDQWGGYLIYRFGGRLKVFIDGRSDFYGRDFLERYIDVADVRPGWDGVLDQERVSHVLTRPEQALAQALHGHPGWRAVYADAVAVIFERVKT